MARYQKKWNNQGGSGRGDKRSKPKKDLPNIPSLDKLPESLTVSFRIGTIPQPKPDYGEFGDAIWTDWDTFTSEIPEIANLPILSDDRLESNDLEYSIPLNPRKIPDTSTVNIEYRTEEKAAQLKPYAQYPEYEIVVKFGAGGKLVLTISSGQSYAARNQINSPILDFSIVIVSSEPIQIASNPAGTLNILQILNSTQDAAFSLYNWILDKLKIVTNNSGNAIDQTLLKLPRRGVLPLPPTSFVWNATNYNLFYSKGEEPRQICLHATNDVVKFKPTTPKTATFLWGVTKANTPLTLCKFNGNQYYFKLSRMLHFETIPTNNGLSGIPFFREDLSSKEFYSETELYEAIRTPPVIANMLNTVVTRNTSQGQRIIDYLENFSGQYYGQWNDPITNIVANNIYSFFRELYGSRQNGTLITPVISFNKYIRTGNNVNITSIGNLTTLDINSMLALTQNTLLDFPEVEGLTYGNTEIGQLITCSRTFNYGASYSNTQWTGSNGLLFSTYHTWNDRVSLYRRVP